MRFHGLVLLAVIGLSENGLAQSATGAAPEVFLPPSVPKTDEVRREPQPLPNTATLSEAGASDIETELKQFRSELREFQILREEVARTTNSTDVDADRVSMQQRQELMALLTKLAKKSVVRKPAKQPVPVEIEPEPVQIVPPQPSIAPALPPRIPVLPPDSKTSDVSVDIADPFALGKVLFRTGDFVGAERAFRKASTAPENEMTIKYLLATCLRRQSRWQSALDAYKVVAESNKDPVLSEMAKWQIGNIRWLQESETQLEKMRKDREKRAEPANGQAANSGAANQ